MKNPGVLFSKIEGLEFEFNPGIPDIGVALRVASLLLGQNSNSNEYTLMFVIDVTPKYDYCVRKKNIFIQGFQSFIVY